MKANLKPLMSSERMNWETPQKLFDELNAEFKFNIDLAASRENAKCKIFITKEDDSLNYRWSELRFVEGSTRCWLNPPYGRELGKWVKKAYEETRNDHTLIVMLIPARTDTRFWHDYVMKAEEIRYVKGRIVFETNGNPVVDKNGRPVGAPFPSAIVIFGRKP